MKNPLILWLGIFLICGVSFASENLEEIPDVFTEVYGGGKHFRFKIKEVSIERSGKVFKAKGGGVYRVTMKILHDCRECGNAVNQIIIGIGGEDKAQVCVWNGKQRSGGELMIVNMGTEYEAYCEDNPNQAEWVKVYYKIKVPDTKGIYYLRARYAQDYQGTIYTKAGLKVKQKVFPAPLGWWTVDRPNGPDSTANIGAIIVE